MGNYDRRMIARLEHEDVVLSTAYVDDSLKPIETAIKHPDYHDAFVVVEVYDTEEEARKGHKKWKERVIKNTLPKTLKDVGMSKVTRMLRRESGGVIEHKRKTKKKK